MRSAVRSRCHSEPTNRLLLAARWSERVRKRSALEREVGELRYLTSRHPRIWVSDSKSGSQVINRPRHVTRLGSPSTRSLSSETSCAARAGPILSLETPAVIVRRVRKVWHRVSSLLHVLKDYEKRLLVRASRGSFRTARLLLLHLRRKKFGTGSLLLDTSRASVFPTISLLLRASQRKVWRRLVSLPLK